MREFTSMAVACSVLIGCGDSSAPESDLDPNVPPITQGNWYRPGVECAELQPFVTAGKPVFNAEYDNQLVTDGAERDLVCAAARAQDIRTLILPLDLDDSFRFSCDA